MKRWLTAALLVPPVTWVVFAGPPIVFLIVVCLIALACYHEFAGIADAHGYELESPVAYAAGLVLLLLSAPGPVVLVLLAMAAIVVSMRSGSLTIALPQAAAMLFGVVYVFGGWSCAIGLRQINAHWLFFALALNWVGDSGAYFAGRAAGRHKLAPRISPAKSWEGGTASLLVSSLFGTVYLHYFIPSIPPIEAALLAAAANLAGQLGDLSESAMKRGAGLKDSGTSLPGHGGWLDRVDSTLFSVPLVYFWLSRATMSL